MSSTPSVSPLPSSDQESSKQSLETGPVLELNESSQAGLPERSTWVSRALAKFSTQHPRACGLCKKFALYIRGPRPKVDLPPLQPIFDIDVHVAGRHVVAPIESTLVKFTRPLTSPLLFISFTVAYVIGIAFFTRFQWFLTPADNVIGCTSTFWLANNQCGLNGEACGPYGESMDFRCPAQCLDAILQNPRTVGNIQAVYVPLIVGGGDLNKTYRGDSFICPAAIQAGIISSKYGGCGSLRLSYNFTNFLPYTANGLTSVGFPTIFPVSFRFGESTVLTHCNDLRNTALALNILVTCALFILLRPKPIITFWCLVCIGFWHVALFSRPRGPPPPIDIAFGAFLPVLFIAYGFWRLAFRFVMPGFSKAPLESCLLYLSGYWVTVLSDLTLDKLPLYRLLASDIKKRSGALETLVIGLVMVLILTINQLRVIRKTGWLYHYLGWYAVGGLVLLALAFLPGLMLRLHHYIVAMMAIPATAFLTRLSAIYQGFFLGLFLNGTAGFGFASILETPEDLLQDASIGTALPVWLTNSTNYNASIPITNQIIHWSPLVSNWDGFALLVDDVQRYIGPATNFSLVSLNASLPHFFRLAYMSQTSTGDFTKAAILWPNGTWVDPLPGPS